MKLVDIAEADFNAVRACRQLISHDYPRRFATLHLGGKAGTFGLNWRSDQIEPQVVTSDEGDTVWVGVDQRLAAIDVESGRVLLSLPLNSSLLFMMGGKGFVAAVTEMSALLFNPDGSFRRIEDFPDVAESASLTADALSVSLIKGESVEVTL